MEVKAIGSATRHIAENHDQSIARLHQEKRDIPSRKSWTVGKPSSSEACDLAWCVNTIVLSKFLRPYGYLSLQVGTFPVLAVGYKTCQFSLEGRMEGKSRRGLFREILIACDPRGLKGEG